MSGIAAPSSGNGATGRRAPRSNSLRTVWRMAGRTSASSSREARRSLTTLRMVGWWPILNPSEPVRRMNQDLSSSANAALSTDVVSTSGSPRAKRSSGRWATLSIWPPEDSNRIVVPTRRWMLRKLPRVSASRARAWACAPATSASMAATSRDSPSWPSTALRNSGTSSGADPSVTRGSVRAFVKPSR